METEVKRSGSGITSFLLVICAIAFVVAAVLRLIGIDGTRHMLATTALIPYITAAGLVLGALALLLRRWAVGMVVTLVAIVLVANVAPRGFPDSRPNGVGTVVRVMTSNTFAGQADAQVIVDAVTTRKVDILALQELTPQMVGDLERAGLQQVMPHRLFLAEPGGSGSGVASRFPLSPRNLTPPSSLRQAGALIDLPDKDIEIVSVHPLPPVEDVGPERWQRELAGLPPRDTSGPVRVLAGDFNATLDHVGLRRILNMGYVDAADQTGDGFLPTWPVRGGWWPPPITIDHILVDARCPVDSVDVIEVPGTDHRAVIAQFVLPTR